MWLTANALDPQLWPGSNFHFLFVFSFSYHKFGSPTYGCTPVLKVGNFRTDFHPYKLFTQTYTQKYSYLNLRRKIRKKSNSRGAVGHWLLYNIWQFLRLSLARFFREGKYAILREIWPMRALETVTSGRFCSSQWSQPIFCRFEPKNVCVFAKFSSFQLLQREVILLKCWKKSVPLLSSFFP